MTQSEEKEFDKEFGSQLIYEQASTLKKWITQHDSRLLAKIRGEVGLKIRQRMQKFADTPIDKRLDAFTELHLLEADFLESLNKLEKDL